MALSSAMKLTAALSLILAFVASSEAGGISIYWGPHSTQAEKTLAEYCKNSTTNSNITLYDYINIGFLTTFGNGQTPKLNLGNHCDPNNDGCTWLTGDIEFCQSQGIKVFLSLGGGGGNHTLTSRKDAEEVATYLWNNFLGGNSSTRPLGSAILDGIDFDIDGAASIYWAFLPIYLKAYSIFLGKKVYLSAHPQCVYPDFWLDDALKLGYFDYVWVGFFNHNYCDYTSSSSTELLAAWNTWTSATEIKKLVFLGIPISPKASGYIPTNNLTRYILPEIQKSNKYGGVMLWSNYNDADPDSYAEIIKPYV